MIVLRSVNPKKNRFRQYAIEVQPTLFGGHGVTARWKRIGTRRGQTRTYYFPTAGEAIKEALHLVELRRRHGYTVIQRDHEDLNLGHDVLLSNMELGKRKVNS